MTIFDPTTDHPAEALAPPPRSPPARNDNPPRLHLMGTDAFFEGRRGVLLDWNVIEDSQARIRYICVVNYAMCESSHRLWTKITHVLHTTFPNHIFLELPSNHRYRFTVCAYDIYDRGGPFSNLVIINIFGIASVTANMIIVRNYEQRHPAPIPPARTYPSGLDIVPPPRLHLQAFDFTDQERRGIRLSWNVTEAPQKDIGFIYVFGYSERDVPPHWVTSQWYRLRRVPHASFPASIWLETPPNLMCHFTVTAEDIDGRCGPYSDPASINLS